jgi:hypothetical protein
MLGEGFGEARLAWAKDRATRQVHGERWLPQTGEG